MKPTTKILVTGAQGLIGWNLFNFYRQICEVVAFTRTERGKGREWYVGLLEDYKAIRILLDEAKPDIIIHGQAMCNLDLCELKPEKTHSINVVATHKLVEAMDLKKQKLVYLSSDHVFSGNKGDYTEEDIPDPVSVYGHTRVEAETYIQKHVPNALIIRPGLAIGQSKQGDIGPHDWLKSRLTKDQPASFFTDEIRSPIRMSELMKAIHHLIKLDATGIYHIGGPTPMSRYTLALKLTQELGHTTHNIHQKQITDDKEVPRLATCTLNSTKATTTGWHPQPF